MGDPSQKYNSSFWLNKQHCCQGQFVNLVWNFWSKLTKLCCNNEQLVFRKNVLLLLEYLLVNLSKLSLSVFSNLSSATGPPWRLVRENLENSIKYLKCQYVLMGRKSPLVLIKSAVSASKQYTSMWFMSYAKKQSWKWDADDTTCSA